MKLSGFLQQDPPQNETGLIVSTIVDDVSNMFIIAGLEVLLRDLPGYANYCVKTQYRLMPLIW